MQTISLNKITQERHGPFAAVDIGRYDKYGKITDLDYYAPEDGTITLVDTVDDDTCGKRLKLKGATGEHGFCHNDKIYVKVGQKVKRGQKLAKMGYTGYTEPDDTVAGTHVHWVLNINGIWVYPPSKVSQSFIKLGAIVKPTKAEVGNMFNLAGVSDEKVTAKQYAYYMARDWKVLAQDVAPMIRKLYTNERAKVAELEKQLAAGYVPVGQLYIKKEG